MTAAVTRLVDYVCAHPECSMQTVWPERAAAVGWFVIRDRDGLTVVVCPAHNNARSKT